ncbi:hypothetical protein L1987_21059 [Smallanthus sonchifolius]|uniref:Uncharacterized protein n=1 Tax=Smallanthus sonchifolius TaxID=185202 RepID=A0ACB9IV03_9ASTR|nr:hypothetical protein L1987_21059 [Smallanthus sonchifolius]
MKGYKIYGIEHGKFVTSRDVRFVEWQFPFKEIKSKAGNTETFEPPYVDEEHWCPPVNSPIVEDATEETNEEFENSQTQISNDDSSEEIAQQSTSPSSDNAQPMHEEQEQATNSTATDTAD